ncbi:hypothetical protein QBC43DRAFT_368209 [Cladorrhinum sp. PSN259]|nr:hypothetical protein QBC43DRAFT_368209 [Cladorrhinum sp. PSN259]
MTTAVIYIPEPLMLGLPCSWGNVNECIFMSFYLKVLKDSILKCLLPQSATVRLISIQLLQDYIYLEVWIGNPFCSSGREIRPPPRKTGVGGVPDIDIIQLIFNPEGNGTGQRAAETTGSQARVILLVIENAGGLGNPGPAHHPTTLWDGGLRGWGGTKVPPCICWKALLNPSIADEGCDPYPNFIRLETMAFGRHRQFGSEQCTSSTHGLLCHSRRISAPVVDGRCNVDDLVEAM